MRRCIGLAVVAVIAMSLSVAWAEGDGEAGEIKLSDLVQNFKTGQVDWGNRWIYASGEGIMPSTKQEPNRGRALLKGKEYAKMAAIANLLMVIEGTTISFEGSGKHFMADVTLRQKIEGYVKNVNILKSQRTTTKEGTIVRVWVGTPIFGEETPGTAFLETLAVIEKPKQPPLIDIPLERSNPKPSKDTKSALEEEGARRRASFIAASRPIDPDTIPLPTTQKGPFTSLIVDARGYKVPHAISPKIRKLNGDQVYGGVLSKDDPAVREGLVSYASTPENARDSDRCGTNPMMVTAIGRGGGRSMCDVIVADGTARNIAKEDSVSKFLEDYRVIFVVDPPGSALATAIADSRTDTKPVRLASASAPNVAKQHRGKHSP